MSKPNREEIIKNIKTCIQSSRGGVPMSSLSRDYHMLIGDPLPYRGLGYTKLEDFIHSIAELKLISGPKGDLLIQTVTNERNSHLARIVTMQCSSNNTRFTSRATGSKPKPITVEFQGFPKKPWTRWTQNSGPAVPRTLRTPSLLRNMSQPAMSGPSRPPAMSGPSRPPAHRTQSSPSSYQTPEAISKIPPLLSVDTSTVRMFPNITLDHRKGRRPQRPAANNNNNEVIYSPIVRPAASVRKPSVPTAEIKATEHIVQLKKLVAERKLGNIDFKTIEMVSGSSKQYISSIAIGTDFKVSTYPNGGSTTQEAMEMAAKLAYDGLLAKLSSPSPELPATKNPSEALNRILKILEKHPNGVWASKVPDEYTSLYGEQLPADWLQQTMDCPRVDPNVISDKQIILVLAEPSTSSEPDNDKAVQQEEADDSQPPPLKLPVDQNWDVYVTNANSTTEVWLRLVGEDYSSLYENLATEMELHYLEHKDGIEEVQEGSYYALALDDCVHRVQVATVEPAQVATMERARVVHCLLLDHGQLERVSVSELRQLEPHFLRLPFQAVQCELQGLEQFSEVEGEAVQALLLDTIVGKTFVAQATNCEILGTAHAVGSAPVTLRLFDTSTEEDVDINQQLWLAITSRVLQPRLPQEGRVVEVLVSHITSEAQIYVQLQSVVLSCIQERISSLQPGSQPQNLVTQPVRGKMYLAPQGTQWYRAIVTALTENMVQVMFVDFGSSAQVKMEQLLDLEQLSPELNQIPHQAVLCRLHHILPCAGARICERTVARLTTLLPPDKPQLLKVMGAASPTAPAAVELFRRIEPDNLLVSLNNTIAMDTSVFEVPECKEEKEKVKPETKDKIDVDTTPRVLSQPKVPEIGGYIDINVTLAASPDNFVVQPWEHGPELEQLMVTLQNVYGSTEMPQLSSADITEGGVYAALHSDNKWYRVQVNNILKGDFLTVFFVDFGDHTMMTVEKLRPLAAKFCHLPCQAIKAKLSGIRPKHSDWCVEDCVRFQELVCNHQFVSRVEETGPDLINPSDTVLGLRLIDTSNDQYDVDIGELLVKEQRAMFLNSASEGKE